ncbi:HigA family addiction module antitoxin [Vibrio sp. 10N.261.46.A3]|uniref:HigA family addiction module antitoxin n=1 Tax=Vibrio sp. 10N.261.46.A3 TaxID=3229658 RepID=UPI0035513355
MKSTKRKPVTVGEMLKEEFLEPMGISNTSFAERIGAHRNVISDLVVEKAELTTPLVIKLAVAFGNGADFWLNIQHAVDLWETRNNAKQTAKGIKPFEEVVELSLA